MEEENQEQKLHVCKICSKSCLNGYSLGGHMRCHLPTITSAKKHEDHDHTHMATECIDDIDNSYGLRENPKKTWRISDAENQCRECGKEFKTRRALAGHMRSHSVKGNEWACKQCGKGFGAMRALFGHMRHHTKRILPEKQKEFENLCPVRRKRSKLRYKASANLSLSNSNSTASCLDVSEVDELEEAALSLIMLSRGLTSLVELNSDSSEKDKSGICKDSGMGEKFECDLDDENWKGKKKVRGKLDSCVVGCWNSLYEEKKSELGEKKADLGFSFDGLSEFGEMDSEFSVENDMGNLGSSSIDGSQKSSGLKKLELDNESRMEMLGAEIEDGNNPSEVVPVKDLVTKVGFLDQDDSDMMKSNSSKEATFDDQEDSEIGGNFCDQINKDFASFSGIIESSDQKKPEYKCRTCNRVFLSHRALGGHRSGHRTVTCGPVVKIGCHESSVESTPLLNNSDSNFVLEKLEWTENVVEEVGFSELKKSKDHECPICFKVFPSGQALGGHKRAHFVGFSENTTTKEIVPEKEGDFVCDLNLPVLSLENEVDVEVGLKPWWIANDRECEQLLLSN